MTPVSSLHFAFLQQANHTDSKYLAETDVIQIDYYLNKSKAIGLEWITSLDDNNDTVRKYLTQLTIRRKKLDAVKDADRYIAQYPKDFYKHKALWVMASREGCDVPRKFKVSRPSSEKLQRALDNQNTNNFWDFEQTFAQEAFDGLHVFTKPELTYEIFIDYLKGVPDVAYVSGLKNGKVYKRPTGEVVNTDEHLQLDGEHFPKLIVDLAALEVKKDYSNFPEYQAQRDFILNIDRL